MICALHKEVGQPLQEAEAPTHCSQVQSSAETTRQEQHTLLLLLSYTLSAVISGAHSSIEPTGMYFCLFQTSSLKINQLLLQEKQPLCDTQRSDSALKSLPAETSLLNP